MFKKLRNKIAEEALRLPAQVDDITESSEVGCSQVQQQYTSFGNNNSKTNSDVPSQTTSTISEDLIDLNNSVASPILQAEKDQFSIIDEDDSNASDPSSPQKSQEDTSAGSEAIYSSRPTMNVEHPEPKYPYSSDVENPAASKQNYVPQSDTESEMEEVQSLNLEGITKEDLVFVLQRLRKRTQKYKGFYAEAVKAYKELHAEKEKLEHAVSETQDKTLRRMAELREQCNLEQQAKAHLEQNLRMVLEEKEQMIHVLETKVRLLKEGNIVETVEDERQDSSPVPLLDAEEKKTNDQDANENIGSETAALKDRIKRQELLLAKCKDTLKSNKERTTQLMEEKNSFEEQLEQKKKEFLDLQVQEAEIQASLRADLQQMREKLIQLEKQQEENAMSMAETKRNMHEELELREQQLSKLKVELQNLQQEKQVVDDKVGEQEEKLTVFQKEHESEISKLQTQLELTEKNMEEERQNLMQELSRGKAAALSLLKEEHAKKLTAVEEEWKAKMNELQEEHQKALLEKEKENSKDLQLQAEDFKKCLLEKTEEMNLAIEEQSLQKTAALSELDIQKDELQRNIEELTTRKMELESQMSNLEEQFKRQREHHQKEIEELTDVHNAQMSGKINEIENLKIDFQKNLGIQKETLEKNYQVCLQETIDKHSDKEQRQLQNDKEQSLKLLEESLSDSYKQELVNMEHRIRCAEDEKMKIISESEEKINELQNKLISVQEELKESSNLSESKIKELESEKENLNIQLLKIKEDKETEIAELKNKFKCEFDDAAKERNETIANMEAEHKLIVNQLQEEIKVLSAQLDESLLVAEVNQSAVSQKVNDYKYQLTELQTAFETLQKEKTGGESELKQKLEVLQFENNKLLNDNLVLENLKKEKELLNNRLKEMEDKYNESSKKDEWFLVLQEENEKLKTDCTTFNNSNEEKEELKIKICELEKEKQEIKDILKEELGKLKTEKQDLTEQLYKERLRTELLNQQNVQKEPDDKDISLLKMENKMLKEQLEVFETQTFGVNHVQNYQKQLLAIQSSYEEKLRDKDMELTSKLKQMVRDFHSQMEQKESECDKTLSCFIEKGQEQEGKMEREHRKELAALHQELFEKNCAMDDLTEHFQQLLHEKENELKDYKQKLKDANLLQVKKERTEDQASQESHRAEVNDWEDGWEDAEDISPVQQQTAEKESQDDLLCTEHLERITSLQTAVTNAQEEITELRFLLGLTSKSSSSSSSNHVDDNSLKVPEPTEFEYLRNILYEYMMGKEPMILAKVITAVLKFSKDQTQQILQREAARQIQDSALK